MALAYVRALLDVQKPDIEDAELSEMLEVLLGTLADAETEIESFGKF